MYKHSDAAKELGVSCITKHPLYTTWSGIKARCTNKKCKGYSRYGAKGIKICERWSLPKGQGFKNFVVDMGSRPSEEYSVDRIDSKGNYEPNNCRWANHEQQTRNRSMHRNNTVGTTGVEYDSYGKNKNSPRYRANWVENKVKKSKSFSVNKYGDEEAYRLACEYRDLMIAKLNEQGAGYSENHGK